MCAYIGKDMLNKTVEFREQCFLNMGHQMIKYLYKDTHTLTQNKLWGGGTVTGLGKKQTSKIENIYTISILLKKHRGKHTKPHIHEL